MKKTLLIALIGLLSARMPVYATQNLSIIGPSTWNPGTSVTLSVDDMYSDIGESYGLSYWLEAPTAIAPFITITGLTYFTFTDGNNIGTFPFSFNSNSGADSGFMTTTTANGQSGDLGGTSNNIGVPPPILPYHVTDITFALAANAPVGTYSLRSTTASPRDSQQVTSDFGSAPFPQASFVFQVVPEPSTFAFLALAAVGTGAVAIRRHKKSDLH